MSNLCHNGLDPCEWLDIYYSTWGMGIFAPYQVKSNVLKFYFEIRRESRIFFPLEREGVEPFHEIKTHFPLNRYVLQFFIFANSRERVLDPPPPSYRSAHVNHFKTAWHFFFHLIARSINYWRIFTPIKIICLSFRDTYYVGFVKLFYTFELFLFISKCVGI